MPHFTITCSGAIRFTLLMLLWYLLAGDRPARRLIGLPAVLLALRCSRADTGCDYVLRWRGFAGFVPFFFWHSLQGACDIMRRVLTPRMPINPGLLHYNATLPEGAPLALLANCISLLPGTISANLHGRQITIHAIDRDLPVWATVQRLEQRVALLFSRPSRRRGEGQ